MYNFVVVEPLTLFDSFIAIKSHNDMFQNNQVKA